MNIMIGATGLDAVKGVAAMTMNDPTAEADTEYGTLIAPNLVAANHDHYFNFRIDFDVDQPVNHFGTMDIVPAEVAADAARRSLWTVEETMPDSDLDARYKLSAMEPRVFHVANPDREGYLGHTPGWMIHHGNVAHGPFDFANDPPMKRNAYIEYSVWVTPHDPEQRYARGQVRDAERRLGHARRVGEGRPAADGAGHRHLVLGRLPPHPADGGLAGDVDRVEDRPHHAAQLLRP
jgi:primary-amine oxidase